MRFISVSTEVTVTVSNGGSPDGYPVSFGIQPPEKFEVLHVPLRVLMIILFSLLIAFGWFLALLYLALPAVAAAFISRDGGEKYLHEDAPKVQKLLEKLINAAAYMWLVTDRFSLERPEQHVTVRVKPTGVPTAGSAILRLITSIPSAIVLTALSIASIFTWIISAIMIMTSERYSDSFYGFHCGIVRWFTRLLAYHASFVEEYPPYTLETDSSVTPHGPAGLPDSGEPA
jgi:hypothetical protein